MGRRRRPAEETRAEILEVAQRHLFERGPEALRLDEIAAEVGISRQAILHYYGNRDGLLRAVVEQAWTGLFRDLATLATADREPVEFADHVDDVVRKRGNARLGAWLLLSSQGLPDTMFEDVLEGLPDRMSSADDAGYRLLMVGAALFGDAIFGRRLRQVLGLEEGEEARADFRRWLAGVAWPEQT